jgi:hypothetical protein
MEVPKKAPKGEQLSGTINGRMAGENIGLRNPGDGLRTPAAT